MRIIAGKFRATKLASIGKGDVSAHLRPTSDRVRESMFSVLSGGKFGNPISGASVLDLFSGTGALGLEALSRGAKTATFVDDGRAAQKLLRENVRLTQTETDVVIINADATHLTSHQGTPCDLIFLDPPYGKALGQKALKSADTHGWIAKDALLVWEESAPQMAPQGFEVLDYRKYGDTHITFLTKK